MDYDGFYHPNCNGRGGFSKSMEKEMNHKNLANAIERCDKHGLWLQREHHGCSKTHIRILTGGATKVLCDEWLITGACQKQADLINSVIDTHLDSRGNK